MDKKDKTKNKAKNKDRMSRQNQLSGFDNKKLASKEPTNSEDTASWSNEEKLQDRTNVNIPSDYSVKKAKSWVDNGSQT